MRCPRRRYLLVRRVWGIYGGIVSRHWTRRGAVRARARCSTKDGQAFDIQYRGRK